MRHLRSITLMLALVVSVLEAPLWAQDVNDWLKSESLCGDIGNYGEGRPTFIGSLIKERPTWEATSLGSIGMRQGSFRYVFNDSDSYGVVFPVIGKLVDMNTYEELDTRRYVAHFVFIFIRDSPKDLIAITPYEYGSNDVYRVVRQQVGYTQCAYTAMEFVESLEGETLSETRENVKSHIMRGLGKLVAFDGELSSGPVSDTSWGHIKASLSD